MRFWTLLALCLLSFASLASGETAPSRGKAQPPVWAQKGAYVYRISTPDRSNVLPQLEEGVGMMSNLLDGSITQIAMLNGVIGHDHRGAWNWDGLWPYWNRVTFRGGGDFKTLSDAMIRMRQSSNTLASFHLNITDVNIGLRSYPESKTFFDRLVAAHAVYRRDFNKQTHRHDGKPYVPREIDKYGDGKDEAGDPDPVKIFAIVNYKNFWDSGLAKEMIDDFYAKLPYAPPILYLDVLNLSGGNFNPGYPDGDLGGSAETQREGACAILDYLRSKGTDIGTEGPRPEFNVKETNAPRAGYVWLHGPGLSSDDYRVISGGTRWFVRQHVYGNAGGFNLSPIALAEDKIAQNKAHYAALLSGKPGLKEVPGPETLHIACRTSQNKDDEFHIPGTGDPFRGDWVDLVNNFYLATLQELYHIGLRNTRQQFDGIGTLHLVQYTLKGPEAEVSVSVPESVGRKNDKTLMLEAPIETRVTVQKAGDYEMAFAFINNKARSGLNIYVNGKLARSLTAEDFKASPQSMGSIRLNAGENTIAFDAGTVKAVWSDGTVAEWKSPYLGTGFKAWNRDVVFAEGYDRMWPDTWSGQKKIYFFSWNGTHRTWKLPAGWRDHEMLAIHALGPDGRHIAMSLPVTNGSIAPNLLPQVPYVVVAP